MKASGWLVKRGRGRAGTGRQAVRETTTETTGGYTYSEDYRRLQVSMIDLPSGRRMWVTTIRQSGDIMDDMDIMTRRIARQLWVDGVVR